MSFFNSSESKVEQEEEEEIIESAVIRKPRKKFVPQVTEEDEVSAEFSLPKKRAPKGEDVEGEMTLKKKAKKKPRTYEETADEFTVQLKPDMEDYEEQEEFEEFVVQKPKKKRVSIQEEDQEFTVKKKKPARVIDEGEDVEGQVKLKRKPRKKTMDEAGAELTVRRDEDIPESSSEEDEPSDVIVRRPSKARIHHIEEHSQEYTIKKKRRPRKPSKPNIPEFTENVTFRPRSTTTKEDVEQEFKISLDQYAEEEISMSGKVKLNKKKQLTYNEEAGEARIRVTQEYDDGSGPIIEEVIDDLSSEEENTMDDIDEPYSEREELPIDYEMKLKRKLSKPEYLIEDIEEDSMSLELPRKKVPVISYDEDSLSMKQKRKPIPKIYTEGKKFHESLLITFCLLG